MEGIVTPFGEIGYAVYKRTYARRLKDDDANSPTEEFTDTVARVVKACKTQLKVGFTEEEERQLTKDLLLLKGSVAGRFWWQLGTKTVSQLGLLSLQNCAFTTVNEPIKPFVWAMDSLMLGTGVGFNIQKEHVYQLPKVSKKKFKITRLDNASADYIIPDTREGWVKLLGKVLKSYFYSGEGFTYSTQLIRGRGAVIKGFGGTASGAEILVEGMQDICNVLDTRRGQKAQPVDCLDLMCIIGKIVVAGNVRRSALIAIGDASDLDYLKAKRWDLGDIPNYRANANLSVVCNNISELPELFWEGYKGNGECYGLINLDLSRKCGRLGETQYPDANVQGYNPCQPAWATVLTPEGVKTFSDIDIGSKIWSKEGWTTVVNKWSSGVKDVYNFRTTTGVFSGTSNHRLDTKSGKVEACSAAEVLTIGGEVSGITPHEPQIVMDGLFLGGGYHKKMKGRDYTYPQLCVGINDYDYFNSEIAALIGNKFSDYGSKVEYLVKTTITTEEKQRAYDLVIPDRYCLKDVATTRSILRGLYSADGSVFKQLGNSCRITYKTASEALAYQVQQMLSSIGIRSYITSNSPKNVEFENGVYLCKKSYDVNITKDVRIFDVYVGFIQGYKNEVLNACLLTHKPTASETYGKMLSSEWVSTEEVFDITVDNASHTYWTGGLSVSNCAEQSLEDKETCCLAEVFLPNIESKEELYRVVTSLYRINKHSLTLPCHLKETEAIVHKNMRMGIGVTGYAMATEEQRGWLTDCYTYLREYDAAYSESHGFPPSIKLTTVKPSGSLSLLAGVTSGGHPAYAPFYIRRMRIAANSPMVKQCADNGYPVEYARNMDGTDEHTTKIVEFPCKFPPHSMFAGNMTAVDQMETIKRLQTEWSDNAVSVTIYYKQEELGDIRKWLEENYTDNVKTMSFLLHSDHGFDQAPLEEITESEYLSRSAVVTPIVALRLREEDISEDQIGCESGICPIK